METSGFKKADALFRQARDLSPEEREAFLLRNCDDSSVRAAVDRLLEADAGYEEDHDHHERSTGAAEKITSVRRQSELPAGIPSQIGHYQIRRIIGTGGMGVICEAMQENPRRRVAMKLIRAGFESESMRRRFEFEYQVLARLRHPNIAQVYDAGIHEGPPSMPYYTMEYVTGARTMQDYIESQKLTTTARLQLFCEMCDAVAHAHQRGVIHRDLKPANVLVDSDGHTKLIDFGVARLGGEHYEAETPLTIAGEIVGTLAYMSPEQIEADPDQIDIRTDVYSLGVMLYEIITRQLPYDVSHVPILEAGRVIQNRVPDRPSSITRHIAPDLETIILKALEKDKDRRYPTCQHLAEDLRLHIAGEPIRTRRDSFSYLVRHTLHRYRWRVAAGALITVALVVALAFGAVAIDRSRQAALAGEVANFLLPAIWGADGPYSDPFGAFIAPVELCDAAVAFAEAQYPEDSEELAEVLVAAARGLAYARDANGNRLPEADLERARTRSQNCIDRVLSFRPTGFLESEALHNLGLLEELRGSDDAILAYERAFIARRGHEVLLRSGPERELQRLHHGMIASLTNWAGELRRRGQLRDCIAVLRANPLDSLDGVKPGWVAKLANTFAACQRDRGAYDEAVEQYRRVLKHAHAITWLHEARARRGLGFSLAHAGEITKGREAMLQAWDIYDVYRPDSLELERLRYELGWVAWLDGDHQSSKADCLEAIQAYRDAGQPDNSFLARPYALMARIHLAEGDQKSAEVAIAEALRCLHSGNQPVDSLPFAMVFCVEAAVVHAAGEVTRATELLAAALTTMRRELDEGHFGLREAELMFTRWSHSESTEDHGRTEGKDN